MSSGSPMMTLTVTGWPLRVGGVLFAGALVLSSVLSSLLGVPVR
jgi:uncharacterized membrane protein YgdD (TMEM256/DUF423 family)